LTTVPDVPALSAAEFYGFLGIHRVMEPMTEELMQQRNEREWRSDDHVRGEHWHTSFHASEFPGDDINACARYLVYRMMDFPPATSMPPWVTTTGTIGKAGELDIVNAWFEGGHALAVPEDRPEGEHQLVFEHRGFWASGSIDLPILKPGWRRPHIVEVKGKADEVLEEMIHGRWDEALGRRVQRRWEPAHRRQVLASLGLCRDFDWGEVTVCENCWGILYADIFVNEDDGHDGALRGRMNPAISPERAADDNLRSCPFCGADDYEGVTFRLEQPSSCSIYYWSRSWPRKTAEFFFEHDQAFMNAGFIVLDQARAAFEADRIPPRPDHFAWSVGACARCPLKKYACKPDFGKKNEFGVTVLSESNGIDHARSLRDNYDPNKVRERVLARWRS
jgi:hypothetical protein